MEWTESGIELVLMFLGEDWILRKRQQEKNFLVWSRSRSFQTYFRMSKKSFHRADWPWEAPSFESEGKQDYFTFSHHCVFSTDATMMLVTKRSAMIGQICLFKSWKIRKSQQKKCWGFKVLHSFYFEGFWKAECTRLIFCSLNVAVNKMFRHFSQHVNKGFLFIKILRVIAQWATYWTQAEGPGPPGVVRCSYWMMWRHLRFILERFGKSGALCGLTAQVRSWRQRQTQSSSFPAGAPPEPPALFATGWARGAGASSA